jgi:hypothetical protein
MLSYLQSGQEVACSPRPTPCWRNLAPCIKLTSSIPHARWCPDCARARSDIIPVLVFSHIWLPRISIWNGNTFMIPSYHPPLSFRSLPPDIWTRIIIHDTRSMHAHTCTYTHIRVVPRYCTGGAPRFIDLSRILDEFWDCDYCGVYILLT